MRYKSKHTNKATMLYSALIMRFAAILGCLTLISAYLLSGVYSKFYTSDFGSDSARVARFSPSFTSTSAEITVENQLPGLPDIPNNSYVIDFSVQNTSDENPSEVAMKYKIVLKTTGNIPLKFTLLDKSENTTFDTWDCDGINGKQEHGYTESSFVFGVGTQEKDEYKLKIEWPSDRNDAQFSGMTDAVYLEVVFEQID